jgi:hypothetical protein
MKKAYIDEQKRLHLFLTQMEITTNSICQKLATKYPEITSLSGYAAIEIRKAILNAYISSFIDNTDERDLASYIATITTHIENAMNTETLNKAIRDDH